MNVSEEVKLFSTAVLVEEMAMLQAWSNKTAAEIFIGDAPSERCLAIRDELAARYEKAFIATGEAYTYHP